MAIDHVYPINDFYPHDLEHAGQCDCIPEVEFMDTGNILVIHNAWDGREVFEDLDNQ